MAPDAPIIGIVDVGSIATWASAGDDAAGQVEARGTPSRPDPVLDVVAEDPQEEQVAEEVQPAAVQELAGHERERLVATGSSPRRPGGEQVGRDDAPRR